jgi:hypothetical protein
MALGRTLWTWAALVHVWNSDGVKLWLGSAQAWAEIFFIAWKAWAENSRFLKQSNRLIASASAKSVEASSREDTKPKPKQKQTSKQNQ